MFSCIYLYLLHAKVSRNGRRRPVRPQTSRSAARGRARAVAAPATPPLRLCRACARGPLPCPTAPFTAYGACSAYILRINESCAPRAGRRRGRRECIPVNERPVEQPVRATRQLREAEGEIMLVETGEPGRPRPSPARGPTAACLGLEARRVASSDRRSTCLGCTSAKEAGPLKLAGVSGHSGALALCRSAPKISCPGSGRHQRTFFASLPRPAWCCLCCASSQTRKTRPCPESGHRGRLVHASPGTSRSRQARCCPRGTSCVH